MNRAHIAVLRGLLKGVPLRLITVAAAAVFVSSSAWWAAASVPAAKAAVVGPDINATADQFTVLGEWTYFRQITETYGDELWRTNGTLTELIRDIDPNNLPEDPKESPSSITAWKGWIWFIHGDNVHGNELWRTNGTITELFVDRNPGPEDLGMTYDIYPSSDFLYFGSADGMERIDVAGNRTLVLPNRRCYLRGPAEYNDNLGANPLYVAPNGSFYAYCWEDDGGAGTNYELYEVTSNLTVRQLTQSTVNCDCRMNAPLLQSDGSWIATKSALDGIPFTEEGLQLIRISSDGSPVEYDYASVPGVEGAPRGLQEWDYEILPDGSIYTWGWDSDHGSELWKVTDGFASRVADLLPGDVGSFPTEISKYKSILLFTADDGGSRGLYYLDGDVPVEVSAPDGVTMSQPRRLTILGDSLFFIADDETETARVYEMDLASVASMRIRFATSAALLPSGFARSALSGTPSLAAQLPAGAEYVGDDSPSPLLTSSIAAYVPFSVEDQESVAALRVDSLAGRPSYVRGLSVLGAARPNAVITSDPGVWAGLPAPTHRFQWYVCSSRQKASALPRVPSGCRVIRGATAATYTPTRRDLNKYLRVLVHGVNEEGSRSYVSPPVQVKRR